MTSPRRNWHARAAVAVVALFVTVAVFADFLASDRPIASSIDDEWSVLDNLGRDDAGARGAEVSAQLGTGDWALWPERARLSGGRGGLNDEHLRRPVTGDSDVRPRDS